MYLPAHFEENRLEVLHGLIDARPLGTLVTLGSDGLNANHLPFELDRGAGAFGTLRAHVARANPVWHDLNDTVQPLVVFQGPHAYVSPSWYPSKRENGRAVPTWNYAVVHAHGPLRIVDDRDWLRALLERLTARHETQIGKGWRIDDAPADYIDKMLAVVVGIEMPITHLTGKWKVSQNQPAANREGVVAGLRELGGEDALGMAELVRGNR
jgi:transcriptional regulator